MLKFFRNLIIIVLVIVVGLIAVSFWFLSSIKYEVTSADLPQDVYEDASGNLLSLAKLKIVGLITADEDERYTLTEEFMNLIILDSIHENINEGYDPLGDCNDHSCDRIINEEYYFIDYAFAELNEDNQIVITISGGANKYIGTTSALRLVFDVEIDISNMSVTFTLSQYYLGDRELSMKLLDYIFDRMNKQSVEDSMSFGTLDLDDYTYSISITDALF